MKQSDAPTALVIALIFDVLFVVSVAAIVYMLYSAAQNCW